MNIDITPHTPMPGPSVRRAGGGLGWRVGWGDIDIHIDINMNIDIHIIIDRNNIFLWGTTSRSLGCQKGHDYAYF